MPGPVLRGYRLGTPTGEPDRDARPAPRVQGRFACRRGHEFTVPFSTDAEATAAVEVEPCVDRDPFSCREVGHERATRNVRVDSGVAEPLGHGRSPHPLQPTRHRQGTGRVLPRRRSQRQG
ncbi:RNA polymerase-binding protein RbpA [Saccharothrix sp. SC076]|nr:RNA polymerase-binding protein RbpA [Saccharothrix obliqua]